MLPSREEAERLLAEALPLNPGPWGAHSRTVAECAEKIAARCAELDTEKAYIVGLLHDIGRRYGFTYLAHVYDGWKYLNALGYDEAARVCLTHSFNIEGNGLSDYIGKVDITPEQQTELCAALAEKPYDDYDRLIQLCDSIGGAGEIMDMEARMSDVKRRYGFYPQGKWNQNFALKHYFETKIGMDLYVCLAGNG